MSTPSKRKALVVGINEYEDFPLDGCVNDARSVASLLEGAPYAFEVKLLVDKDVSRSTLRKALSDALESADEVVIYFAGHGVRTDISTYLLTPDASEDDDGVELEYVRRLIETRGRNCKLVVLILDCCHAGAAKARAAGGTYPAATAHDIVTALPFIGDGRILLAACRADQSAYETKDRSHGEFTSHLLAGLNGAASGPNGEITVHTLYEYLSARFQGNAKQTPMFRGDTTGRIVIASGFSSGSMSSAPQLLAAIVKEGQQHLDDYHLKTTGTVQQWKASGHRAASDLLAPILDWFSRRESQHPTLKKDPKFNELRDAAFNRLQQLASLERGVETRYGRVEDYLGGGTFGAVYKLVDAAGKVSALKVYHPQDLRHGIKVARFRRGYDAMRQLDHPHIVRVGEYSECPPAFVMNFIDGPNLKKVHVSSTDPLHLIRTLLIVAETLQHAHGRRVIHRDVKPENIIMKYGDDGTWTPYLTDFDLAWFSTATHLTKDALGTVFYAAPEQLAKPSAQIAHAATTDIYSFGQLMYYTLTGSDPVPLGHADNRRALSERLDKRYTQASAEALLRLYDDCTQYDPRDRVQDFRRICDRLYTAYQHLANRRMDTLVPLDDFLAELRFAMVGLVDDGTGPGSSFTSLSTRTGVTLSCRELGDGLLRVEAHFEPQGAMALQGVTNDVMRPTINIRIDAALQGFDKVRRRSGKQGAFEVSVDIAEVRPSTDGVEHCREIITRVIDAMER